VPGIVFCFFADLAHRFDATLKPACIERLVPQELDQSVGDLLTSLSATSISTPFKAFITSSFVAFSGAGGTLAVAASPGVVEACM
jgi:hypothetical protein